MPEYQFSFLDLLESEEEARGPEEVLQEIVDIMDTMDEDEIDEFGVVLYETFFEDDPETELDDAPDFFEASDVDEMIQELGPEVYEDVLDLLEEIEDDSEPEEANEAVSRRLSSKDRNRKKRKFMAKSKADLRKTKAKRKQNARKNRQSRKKYYRKNKQKIKAYQKSRRDAIKKGKHKVKKRRST